MELVIRLHKVKVLQCNKCQKIFANQNALEEHRMSHEHIFSSYVRLERIAEHKCRSCAERFPSLRDLRLHELFHVREFGTTSKAVFSENYNKMEKPFKCDECSARFVLKSTLDAHSVLHAPFPNVCDCGIGYYTSKDLRAHQRLVHKNNKFNGQNLRLEQEVIEKEPISNKNSPTSDKNKNVKNNTKQKILNIKMSKEMDVRENENERFDCLECDKDLSKRSEPAGLA